MLLLTIVKTGLDAITLLQSKVVHITEPPWINYSLKNLIWKRQSELNQGNLEEFRHRQAYFSLEIKIETSRLLFLECVTSVDCGTHFGSLFEFLIPFRSFSAYTSDNF